ncbi:MAG: sigma-70 family RNA polymerase sigma factor [Tepidisphaeraceae bacterium]
MKDASGLVDDQTLMLARQGDRKARDRLIRSLQDPLYRFCLHLLNGNENDAVDAVQETALRLLKHLSGFDGRSSLRTWAFGIAVNVAREMRRKRKPAGSIEEIDVAGPDNDHGDSLDKQATLDRVKTLLEGLGERQREALLLRFFEEQSVEQTAETMKCSQGTVKATVFQALRVLRGKLGVKSDE